MANSAAASSSTDEPLQRVYHKLKVGVGHELVNDGNVHALIRIADGYGDTLVATLLREWEAPCGDVGVPEPRRNGAG